MARPSNKRRIGFASRGTLLAASCSADECTYKTLRALGSKQRAASQPTLVSTWPAIATSSVRPCHRFDHVDAPSRNEPIEAM